MYKDKDRQREAVKKAVRRHRGKLKGITVIPVIPVIPINVIPSTVIPVIPKTVDDIVIPIRKGAPTVQHHPACKCYACNQ
jgi:hypothetical protein